MKTRSRIAISAAVAALMFSANAPARDLIWDANGTEAPLGKADGGNWDTTSSNWVDGDLVTGTNTTWNNATPDSAIFGSPANTTFAGNVTPHDVELTEAITVNNITLNLSSAQTIYNIADFNGGSLTLQGNITKASAFGNPQMLLLSNGLQLTAGNHTIGANDTSGDAAPELTINGEVKGPGNVIIDNGGYITWGTIAFNLDNSYTGTTTISKGRLVITHAGGLGSTSAGTTITNLGSLSIGGSNLAVTGGLNITEPLTVQRSVYTGGDFGIYPAAIIINNNGSSQTHTISGPLIIDSADARIAVNTNTLVLPGGNISRGPSGATGLLSFTGDTAGFVVLQGDNSAALATTGILITGGVEVQPASDLALGGATAPISMTGGVFKPFTGMTTFGAHPINTANFGGGVNVPDGQSFTIDQVITGGGGVGKRGTGSLTFAAALTGTGAPFWDGGNVEVNAPMTLGSLHLRSPIVNINNTGSITLSGGDYNSFGQDSGGTNGGPDIAVINIKGNGKLIQTNGNDFNLSDNNNTKGTINLADNGVLTAGGIMFIGKSTGATGTITQTGGTLTSNRTGNFGFVLADGRGPDSPTGIYNLSGGTFTANGEVYVGEGGSNAVGGARGHGFWNQTGGAVTFKNWFVVGRESAVGSFDISGGTITQTGGNFDLGDSNAGGEANTVNIHGTASITTNGEFWIGNNGSAITNATMADTATVSVSNWLAIGRGGGTGTLNMSGGTINQTGGNWFTIGSGGTGTVNLSGGTINAAQMYIGQNGGGTGTLNITGGAVNITNNAIFANNDSITGNLNLSGGTLTAFGFTAQNGGGTGKGNFTFNGGTLRASADNTNFVGAKVTSVVSTGGAKIDSNGKSVTYNSALTHDAALGATLDGGLTKSGSGLLKLTGANTYTGNTSVLAGTLQAGTTTSIPAMTNPARTIVSPGATLGLSVGGAGQFASTDIDSVLASGVLVPGTSLGLDPSTPAAGFTHANVISGSIGVTKLGSGTLKLTAANTYTGRTTANGTGSLVLTQPAWAPVLTGGGAVVNSSKLVFDYTGTASPAATLVPLLKSSHDSSNFRDATKQIYTTNATDATHGIGYFDDGTSTLSLLYTWYGDANGDGKVNADDYVLLDRGRAKGIAGWQNGDFNYDGTINDADYLLTDTSFVAGGGGALSPDFLAAREAEFGSAYVSQLIAAVPEPASLCVMALAGATTLLARRRRSA